MAFYTGTATVVIDAESMEEAEEIICDAIAQGDFELTVSKDEE